MSQKENLLKFLDQKTTTFTVADVNAIKAIVESLEEPKPEEKKASKK